MHWLAGSDPGGRDSRAVQVAERAHWPEMRVLVLVVNATQKKVSSTNGMATTVQNSELFRHRIERCVGRRVDRMKRAIAERDFATFAEITMKDSNQFHAVCLDSYPPIVYMNDVSHSIAQLVHKYNEHEGETRVAYTFDAGPNAVLYLLEKDVTAFVAVLSVAFPVSADKQAKFVRGLPVEFLAETMKVRYCSVCAMTYIRCYPNMDFRSVRKLTWLYIQIRFFFRSPNSPTKEFHSTRSATSFTRKSATAPSG